MIVSRADLANDNRCLREWAELDECCCKAAFSPDGQVIATVQYDDDSDGDVQPVYLRTVSDGATSRVIMSALLRDVSAVVFSPDGGTLALCGTADDDSGPIELWKLATTEDTSYRLTGHSTRSQNLAYSPDGTILASYSYDMNNTIRLWDVETGQCVRTLLGHTALLDSISFTPDGNFLASGSSVYLWSGYIHITIRVWSISSGNCIQCLNTDRDVKKYQFGRMWRSKEFGRQLRVTGTLFEELQKEYDDLMKLTTEQLQKALTENETEYDSDSTKVALVNHLVTDFDRKQRKDIFQKSRLD
jgi:dipeptidyl aminopeptidase/acylaminoacyl peptidase